MYKQAESLCKENLEVACEATNRKCGVCGWNPKVSEKRLEKIREKLGVKKIVDHA